MNNTRKLGYILLVFFILCSCRFVEGRKNEKVCRALNNSISKEELMKKMGQPFQTESTDKEMVLYFESNPVAAGPVRILVDPKGDAVVGKKCFEDGEWVYFTDSGRVNGPAN